MGFKFRKSINLGAGFHINLSTKGVGYSWGVKGYRVTKTADGRARQTVSIPGTGISYVEERGSRRQKTTSQQVETSNLYEEYTNVQRVQSADIAALRSAEYEDLFMQIKHTKFLRIVAVILTLLSSQVGMAFFYLCVSACAVFFFLTRSKIIYEFDDMERSKWNRLSAAWKAVAESQSLLEITVCATAKNTRTNAGIKNSVDTIKMTAGRTLPWYIRTNIQPVVFKLKDSQIAIMPDRLLIFSKKKLGAVEYKDIDFDITAVGFLESGTVPTDAELVKYVWAYANNDGTPDKRYANNKQFPIMKYGKISMKSASGVNIQFMCSNEKASDELLNIIQ